MTVTIHAWQVVAYLGIGLACYIPMSYLYYRRHMLHEHGFWATLRANASPFGAVVQVLTWPLAWWIAIHG